MLPRPSGLVTLSTDFGHRDPYVGVMKGAMLRAASKVQIVDVGHDVPPQDLEVAAFFVAALIGRFPAGTVHLTVVDPGVGTARRLLAVAAHDGYWLAPDNGVLSPVLAGDAAVDVRAIDVEHLGVRPESHTFHGRDVLGPVAAWLATGRYGFSALGPRVVDPVRAPGNPTLRVLHVDHYGNLISNVTSDAFGAAQGLRVGGRAIPKQRTFGDVPPGELLAYVGSYGFVEVARREGSAAQALEVGRGAPVELWLR